MRVTRTTSNLRLDIRVEGVKAANVYRYMGVDIWQTDF